MTNILIMKINVNQFGRMTRNLKVKVVLLTKEVIRKDGHITQISNARHPQSEKSKVLSGGYEQHPVCQERGTGNLSVRYLCNVGHLLHSNHDDSDTEMIHVCCYISLSPECHSYVVQWYTRRYLRKASIKQQNVTVMLSSGAVVNI